MSGEKKPESTVDLHGAAIIDENGKEVPITESMLSEAFDKLIETEKSPQDKDQLKPNS